MSSEHTLNTLLELDHISKIYGDLRAVDDLTLTVPQGEWLAIVGSSGSGKTTLMNMLSGIYRPDSGSIFIGGQAAVIRSPEDWLHGHAFKGFRHAGRPQVGGFERQAACRRA